MDISAINRVENRERTAIVVVGYNRVESISRLLDSLLHASYKCENVPLVISIDASGNEELYDKMRSFEWPHGDLYVRIQNERLGLKNHIFSCLDMSQYFRGVILLEDDLVVAPAFYNYTLAALDAYEQEDKVCGVALYGATRNGYAGLPFMPMQNGCDVYLYQDVCTWGECLTYAMWSNFRKWLVDNEQRSYEELEMPVSIKQWKRAWSKYYYAYMVESNKAFITPYISYTTNFGEIGEHGSMVTNVAQVPLQWGMKRHFSMLPLEQLVTYDAYSNNTALYEALGLSKEELTLDLYSNNDFYMHRRFVLTTRSLPCKIVREFALSFYPIEVNVLQGVNGRGIRLYDTTEKAAQGSVMKQQFQYLSYYFGLYNPWLLLRYMIVYCFRTLCRKLRLKR